MYYRYRKESDNGREANPALLHNQITALVATADITDADLAVLFGLKVPSHQFRSARKWYDWVGLD